MSKPSPIEIHQRFSYNPPRTDERKKLHDAINTEFEDLAQRVTMILPEGRDLALTLTHLEDGRMRANAALATQPETTQPETAATDARDRRAWQVMLDSLGDVTHGATPARSPGSPV